MAKQFASAGDMAEKKISFTEIGKDLWAFTAEGDPNTGVIIGDDSVMIVEAQATPRLANKVIEKVRTVTDKPINHVVLTALSRGARARRLGLRGARRSSCAKRPARWSSNAARRTGTPSSTRFPRLFQGHEDRISRPDLADHDLHRAA